MRGDAAWRACGHAPGHPAMPNACHFGSNNLFFQKTLIFWETSQGQGMQQPRPRQPPMGTQPRHGHAAAKAKAAPHGHSAGKAWASTQQPRPGRARSSQGRGVHAWARWHAPGRRQQGPWGHAGCLRGSGSMSRAWHAPWVGCQGRGMPLGPLEGHGSIWGGCCCQA